VNIVKPTNIHLAFHCKLSSVLCPGSKEEKDYMSCVQYVGYVLYSLHD
jgi:hypothetical protein